MGDTGQGGIPSATGWIYPERTDIKGWPFPFDSGAPTDADLERRKREQEEIRARVAAFSAPTVPPEHGCPTSRVSED